MGVGGGLALFLFIFLKVDHFTFENYFTLWKVVLCIWKIFFCYHNFMKKGHSKFSKNESGKIQWINITYLWRDLCRRCWLKGPHQIPSVNWIFHHSLHFHIYQIVSFTPGILCPLYCYYEWWGDVIGGGWLIHIRVWVGGQGVGIIS